MVITNEPIDGDEVHFSYVPPPDECPLTHPSGSPPGKPKTFSHQRVSPEKP